MGAPLKGAEVCRTGCQYSKDVGAWPEHSCAGVCVYAEAEAGATYRLLTRHDVIREGDEVISDDTLSWLPLVGWEIGLPYRPELYQPARRRLANLADATPNPTPKEPT
jgi:hypothetical protein